MATQSLKVFLCYSSVDKRAVLKLYHYLKKRGINIWMDITDLLPGQTWPDEIQVAINKSDAIIICLSKSSITKEGFIQKEIKFALDKAKEIPPEKIFLIPAKLEECEIPNSLADYHWVNLFEENGYSRLMRSLRLRTIQIAQKQNSTEETRKEASDKNGKTKKENNAKSAISLDNFIGSCFIFIFILIGIAVVMGLVLQQISH